MLECYRVTEVWSNIVIPDKPSPSESQNFVASTNLSSEAAWKYETFCQIIILIKIFMHNGSTFVKCVQAFSVNSNILNVKI